MINFFLFILILFFYSFSVDYTYIYKKNEATGGLIGFEKRGNKLVRKFYYNKAGILQREEFFKKKKIVNYRNYQYKNKLKIREEYLDSKKRKKFFCTYRYNENGQLEKRQVFFPGDSAYNISQTGAAGNARAKGKKDIFYIYKYNNGILTQKIEKKNKKTSFIYYYYFGDKTLRVEKKTPKGTLIRTFEYKYDDKGKIIKAKIVKVSGS